MRKAIQKNAKHLTDKQIATLKENALGILSDVRKTVLNRFPFVGSIAMGLDLVPTRDSRISTMATDGTAIYCDIDFLSTLSNDDRIFILAHEVYHNVMLHSMRREHRDHELFNYCTDMEVNSILKADGLVVPKTAVMPSLYCLPDGKSAEEYYDMLVKRNESNVLNLLKQICKCGADDGTLDGQFDIHICKGDEVPEDGDETKQDSYGLLGCDPDYRPNLTQSAVERVREAAVAAAQMIERQRGSLPDHQKRLINGLLEPKLDWRELLSKFVTKSEGECRTWNRCNRRFISSGTYLPSTEGDKLKIAVGIDTSGSVYSILEKFLAELKGIVSNFSYELTVIQCDTEVKSADKYDTDNPLDLDNVKFKVHGGGGTMLHPIFDYINDKQIECDCCVVLTDGECETFTEADVQEFPVLWCVTKGGNKKTLGFGEVCDLD